MAENNTILFILYTHCVQFFSSSCLLQTHCKDIFPTTTIATVCQIASTLLNQTNDHFIYLVAYHQYFTQPVIPSFLKDFLPFTWLPGHHPLLDVLLSHCFLASFANSCISLRLLNTGVPKMGFACVLSRFSHV